MRIPKARKASFYVWTPRGNRAAAGAGGLPAVARHFGLDRAANFEGHWHLHVYRSRTQLAGEFSITLDEVDRRIDRACAKLLAVRAHRVRPGRDEKILTAWNGLMIRGMAIAGRHLGNPAWIASAERAVDFIRARSGKTAACSPPARMAARI